MANIQDEAALAELKKKRTFRKFSYRGVDLDQLLDMNRSVTLASVSLSLFFVFCAKMLVVMSSRLLLLVGRHVFHLSH